MHCPLCGKKLILLDEQRYEREEYRCDGGCFEEDYPLYFHHPFRGTDSRPGDSWSLSYVK